MSQKSGFKVSIVISGGNAAGGERTELEEWAAVWGQPVLLVQMPFEFTSIYQNHLFMFKPSFNKHDCTNLISFSVFTCDNDCKVKGVKWQ